VTGSRRRTVVGHVAARSRALGPSKRDHGGRTGRICLFDPHARPRHTACHHRARHIRRYDAHEMHGNKNHPTVLHSTFVERNPRVDKDRRNWNLWTVPTSSGFQADGHAAGSISFSCTLVMFLANFFKDCTCSCSVASTIMLHIFSLHREGMQVSSNQKKPCLRFIENMGYHVIKQIK
jgi:hypothetical protein